MDPAVRFLEEEKSMTPNDLIPFVTDPTGKQHMLDKAAIIIGRAVECDIVITSKRVSREHTRLQREGRKVAVEDMGSTNGTYLNGERITNIRDLRDGDHITIGDVDFIFHDPDVTHQDTSVLLLEVNQAAGVVRVNRKAVELSPKEFLLLVYLYDHRGTICSKDDISQSVWPEFEIGTIFDYQIENLVRRLRTRLEPDPNNPQVLLTVRGQGYKLDLPR